MLIKAFQLNYSKKEGRLDLFTDKDGHLYNVRLKRASNVTPGQVLLADQNKHHQRYVVVKTIDNITIPGIQTVPMGSYLWDKPLVEEFKAFAEKTGVDYTPAPLVVLGVYHYGFKNSDGHRQPYINTVKKYNFLVTNRTYIYKPGLKVGHTARVISKHGRGQGIIHNITLASGSIARRVAYGLKPVTVVHNHGLNYKHKSNSWRHWLEKLYQSNVLAKDGKQK